MNKIYIRYTCGQFRSNLKKLRSYLADEKGLALPLALAIVALGSLIIGPFLAHAGTAAMSSGTYGEIINENSAAEAGVEKAIFDLTFGSLAAQIPDAGNSVSYQLARTVNYLTPGITVTHTQAGGGSEPAGTISALHSITLDSGSLPAIIKISDTILAVVYSNTSSKGIVQTIDIASDGQITAKYTYTFENNTCNEPDIVNVDGNIFAIAYRGQSNRGYLTTVRITAAGIISTLTDPRVIDNTNTCYTPDIIKASGNLYIVAYSNSLYKGYITTSLIETNGTITNPSVMYYNYTGSTNGREPCIINVSGDIYGIVYRRSSSSGYAATLQIASNGIITQSLINNIPFDTGYTPRIIHISGTTYAIVYRRSSNWSYLDTLTISSSGTITISPLVRQVFHNNPGYDPEVVGVSSNVFAIVYQGPADDGFIETWQINATSFTYIDYLEFDTSNGYQPAVLQFAGDIYAIAYKGKWSNINVNTVRIATGTGGSDLYTIQSTAGGSTITAGVEIESAIPIIHSWLISR